MCALSLLSITIMLALPTVSASSDSFSDLKSSISGFDDPRMGTEDLAFFLVSHGFDARPKIGFVEVYLGGHTCKLTTQRLGSGTSQHSGMTSPLRT
jgi:hypothetical protein